jgi:DNA-binding NarL/FixJ family response regulator
MRPCPAGKSASPTLHLAFLGFEQGWPADLEAFVARELVGRDGATIERLADVSDAPTLLRSKGLTALVVNAEHLGPRTQVVLRECRRLSPATAVVVVGSSQPRGLKDALEVGATAFLSWPASPEVFRQALRSVNESNDTRTPAHAGRRRGEGDARS